MMQVCRSSGPPQQPARRHLRGAWQETWTASSLHTPGAASGPAAAAMVGVACISRPRAQRLRLVCGPTQARSFHLNEQITVAPRGSGSRPNASCEGQLRTALLLAIQTRGIVEACHDALPQRPGVRDGGRGSCRARRRVCVAGEAIAADTRVVPPVVGLAGLRRERVTPLQGRSSPLQRACPPVERKRGPATGCAVRWQGYDPAR
jgi:hypothetical protein